METDETRDRRKKNIVELTRCSVSDYRAMPKLPLRVMADNIRSMYNVGAIFRTADAFCVEEVILAGISGCPPHQEISKTALGAEESVAWHHVGDAVAEAKRLQQDGWRVCALEQAHDSVPLQDFRVEPGCRYLLVAGNEVDGVSQEIVDMADCVIEIPQRGIKHSLNVSSSASILMWHFFSQMNF